MGKKPPDPPGDIPAWVMTFSDVITLLMTFFILLLTFATNEPEAYDQMTQSMFGASGASGVASEIDTNTKDSLLMRERTRVGRSTKRGSGNAARRKRPITTTALSKGIAGLDNDELRELASAYVIRMPWSAIFRRRRKTYFAGEATVAHVGVSSAASELSVWSCALRTISWWTARWPSTSI